MCVPGYLGDKLVVVGQVSPAVDAAVRSMAARQVCLERLGARHSDHGRSGRALQEGAAGPVWLAWEAPQDTGEGRGGWRGGRHEPAGRGRGKGEGGGHKESMTGLGLGLGLGWGCGCRGCVMDWFFLFQWIWNAKWEQACCCQVSHL